jgi:hypothetical protein
MILPHEMTREIASYLTPSEIKQLHCTSKALCEDTAGIVKMEALHAYHFRVGGRIHRLEMQRQHLDDMYRQFKCRGPAESRGYTRARRHQDYLVYDRCVRLNSKWSYDYIFVYLRGAMDSLASYQGVPTSFAGCADVYYDRGVESFEPIPISSGATFSREDLQHILSFLTSLYDLTVEVMEAIQILVARHEMYASTYKKLSRIAAVIQNRIIWLNHYLTN